MENNKKNEAGEQSSNDRNQNIDVTAGTDNRNPQNNKKQNTPSGPGSSGEENADMDRDLTMDAEIDKSAEAPGNDPAKKD